jgi:GntR family transcriptional regulator
MFAVAGRRGKTSVAASRYRHSKTALAARLPRRLARTSALVYYIAVISKMGWQLDLSAGPIFLQIAANVRQMLARGDLVPGQKLPSARELAVELGINPNTVVHAFGELERMAMIETKRGLGTFVRGDAPVDSLRRDLLQAAAAAYAAEVTALGISPRDALGALREVLNAGES